ncbi:hypothetical protein NBRC116601_28560 [Cognatishimia sp. WU-CL00825]|uniref:hypothetical protein n=1 Tax=Cognatishimia sp. WU-CL00825 TaxID=3127658 RepID=UPI0031058608
MTETSQTALAQDLGFQPGEVLRTFGMRRSGNHAIINWLLRNAEGNSTFLNNCTIGKAATQSWRAVEVNAKRMPIKRGTPISDVTAGVGDGALLVVSYEDFLPDPDEGGEGLTTDVPMDLIKRDIVLYRHFMNWSASLLRKIQANEDQDTLVCLRIMMVALDKYRELLELVSNSANNDFLPINYDRWVARPRYRARILQELGLPHKDNSLGSVQPYGGGSSFQKGVKLADKLATDERWREMVNDPAYQLVLLAASQDRELVELMQKLMPADADMLVAYLDQAQFPYHVEVAD